MREVAVGNLITPNFHQVPIWDSTLMKMVESYNEGSLFLVVGNAPYSDNELSEDLDKNITVKYYKKVLTPTGYIGYVSTQNCVMVSTV